jgi:hypothetical protein
VETLVPIPAEGFEDVPPPMETLAPDDFPDNAEDASLSEDFLYEIPQHRETMAP